MELLIDFGLFVGKVVIIVVALLIIINALMSQRRTSGSSKGTLEAHSINKNLDKIADSLMACSVSKEQKKRGNDNKKNVKN